MDDAGVERADRQHDRYGARGAWCRAGRRRTARPAGCRTAAAGTLRPRAGSQSARARDAARVSVRRPSSTAARICAARASPIPGIARKLVVARADQAVQAARPPSTALARSSALARARRGRGRSRAARCRQAPPAPTRCSFSRGRSCGATVFIVHHTLLYFRAMRRLSPLAAHAPARRRRARNPPKRNRSARRVRSTPRARPAPNSTHAEAFTAATSALQQAHEAVDQRDYRLALSRAIDACERAQDAAKLAADGKAKARSDAEMIVSTANAAALALDAKLKAADAAHVPARDLAEPRRISKDAAATLQKARANLKSGAYLDAIATVKGLEAQIHKQIQVVDAMPPPRAPRRTVRDALIARRSNGHARCPLPTQFLNPCHCPSPARRPVGDGCEVARDLEKGSATPARSLRRRARPTRSGTSLLPSTRPAGRPRGRRSGRPGRRRRYWIAATAAAHAPVPEASVGPTPRSQIRIRTRSGASTVASSTFVPAGKWGWTDSAAASECSRVSAHFAEDDTLRVPDPQRDRFHRAAVQHRSSSASAAPERPSRRGRYTGSIRHQGARDA